MENKLSAPVGDPKADPKPANKPKDVATLEIWVIAQGASYTMTGKVTPALVKWIKAYQGAKGKLPKAECTGVIAPGDKTWNAGAGAYFRYRDKIAAFEAYEVVEKGKTKRITVDAYVRLQTEARRRIVDNANAVQSQCDVIMKLIQGLLDQAAGSEGYVNAFVALTNQGFGLSPPPSKKAALDARGAAGMLIAAVDRTTVDWKKVEAQARKTQKLYDKAAKEWNAYNAKTMKRAEWGATTAGFVSDGAFGVLEVLATGYLVSTRGMNPRQAQMAAAMGCEGLKVSAGEFGEWAANDKFDPAKSAINVFGSMLISGAANAAGAKIAPGAMAKVLGRLDGILAREFNAIGKDRVARFVRGLLTSGRGEEFVKSALNEIGNMGKKVMNGGKLSEKDVIDALVASLAGSICGSAEFKALKKFDAGIAKRADAVVADHFQKIMHKRVFMKLMIANPKGPVAEMLKDEGADITVGAAKKISEAALKAIHAAPSLFDGDAKSEAELTKRAMKALEKDTRFLATFEAAALAEAERRLARRTAAAK